MFYPSLLEYNQERDLSLHIPDHISEVTLRDDILGAGKKLPVKIDMYYLSSVDGKTPEDLITWDYIWDLDKNHKYTKNLFSYLNSELDIDVKDELDRSKKLRKKNPNHLPDIEIPISFFDFWTHQIENYEGKDDESTVEKKEKVSQINLEKDFRDVFEFFTNRGKIGELTDFVLNMPHSGGILVELKDLLRIFKEIINSEDKIKIHKGDKSNLPKDQYEKWKEDMIEHIGSYERPEDLNSVYKSEIIKEGSFLNFLFNLEPKGVGKGEFMLSYTIPYSSLSGGSEDYDLIVDGQAIYEVKDYSGNPEKAEIRLGTHGKLSQFEFFQEIKNTVSVAKRIRDNMSDDELRSIVGKYNFQYWRHMTSPDNYNENTKAIPSAVNAGELPPPRLKIIIDWCFLNHLLIEKESEDEEKYTTAILKGNKMNPVTVKIEPLKTGDLSSGKTVTISELEDQEKMMNELRQLKYVLDPYQLVEDLQNSPQEAIEKTAQRIGENESEFLFILFRSNEIKVLSGSDFYLATISQSAIKIREGSKKELSTLPAIFKGFKGLPKDSTEGDFYDYYKNNSQNESFYPQLLKL